MGDPRNVAHAKKVTQEKHHKGDHAAKGGARQAGKKTSMPRKGQTGENPATEAPQTAPGPAQKPDAAKLEKSLAVLAQLKDLEFHSRANIEKLAELSLTIEDELKQKAFVESIEALYSAQDTFHSKASALVEAYQAECDRLKPPG